MPTIYERPSSRSFSVSPGVDRETLLYFVTGTTNEQDVYELLVATAPPKLGALLWRSDIRVEALPGGHWFCDVEYGPSDTETSLGVEPVEPSGPGLEAPLGPSYSFDTTGATVHITQAKLTHYRRTAADGAGPGIGSGADEKLAIGLTKDRVEGVDIHAPAFTFTKTVQRASINMLYVNTALYGLTGAINDAPFYGFARGEVLYLGCTGNYTAKERWTLTHKFACQPNLTDIDVGGGITVPAKWGWEYLWVAYAPAKVGNSILQEPHTAYVQQVYYSGDFSLLQIGV